MKSKILITHIWNWDYSHNHWLWIEPGISQKVFDELEKNWKDWIVIIEEKVSELDKHISIIISMYYNLVDSDDFETYRLLSQLYSDNIEYNRCDLSIKWKEEFIEFFEERFKNLKIKHNIEEIIPYKNKVYVKWSFSWKNLRLNQDISWDFVDVHTFSEEEEIWKRKIIKRRTYLSNDTLKKYYDDFQSNLIKENDILEIKVLEEHDKEILIEFSCQSCNKKSNYIKHKFMRMWYWIEAIKWININWENINTVLFFDLKKWWNESFYDSSIWSDLIK